MISQNWTPEGFKKGVVVKYRKHPLNKAVIDLFS